MYILTIVRVLPWFKTSTGYNLRDYNNESIHTLLQLSRFVSQLSTILLYKSVHNSEHAILSGQDGEQDYSGQERSAFMIAAWA